MEEDKILSDLSTLTESLNEIKKEIDYEKISQYLISVNTEIMLKIAAVTSKILNEKQTELQTIKWKDGESNTDSEFSQLACSCAESAWLKIKSLYPLLNDVEMIAIIPDINCHFFINEKSIALPKNKIELKSSKNQTMPGSTINKLDINMPLIYCHRPKKSTEKYNIRYGQYYNSINDSDIDLFQDRTPRPQISFGKLLLYNDESEIKYSIKEKDDWIVHYGKCAINRLKRDDIGYSWQDTLTKSILFEALKDVQSLEDIIKLRDLVKP